MENEIEELEGKISSAFRKFGASFLEVDYSKRLQDVSRNERRQQKEQLKVAHSAELNALEAKISEMMIASLSAEPYVGKNHIYIDIQKKPEKEDIWLFVFKAFLEHFKYPLKQVEVKYPDLLKSQDYRRIMEKILQEEQEKNNKQRGEKEEIVLLFDHIAGLSLEECQSVNGTIITQGPLYRNLDTLAHITINNVKDERKSYRITADGDHRLQLPHDYTLHSIPCTLLSCLIQPQGT